MLDSRLFRLHDSFRRDPKMGLLTVGIAGIIFGAIIFAISLMAFYHEYATQSWPQIPAKVTLSYVKKYENERGIVYIPSVTYYYLVEGEKYIGEEKGHNPVEFLDKANAEAWLEQYPVDKEIMVHYNPQNSRESLINNAYNFRILNSMLPLSLVCLLFGGRMFCAAYRALKSCPKYQKKLF
ncbi:MAG: DUF3592 domain-containing protein [Alphaproteobacteria bacterium]|nr:DUF3592 domain-containing protein [Alphaproteobacteria bacterium]